MVIDDDDDDDDDGDDDGDDDDGDDDDGDDDDGDDDDGADVDDLWQTVQPSPISEKQAQWLRLQFCPVTVGVMECIKCSQLSHLF